MSASDKDEIARWFDAAREAYSCGGLDLAADALSNAIRLESDPKHAAQLWDSFGHVRWDQKRYDEAVEAFREAIFRDGLFPGPWHDIAKIRMELGDPAAAVEFMRDRMGRIGWGQA